MNTDTEINFVTEQNIPTLENIKPKKPKLIKKPIVPKKPAPQKPKLEFKEKIQEKFKEIPQKSPPQITRIFTTPIPQPAYQNKRNEPKETLGYDTLNPFLYKFSNYLILPSLLTFITLLILTTINYFFFPNLIWNLYGGIITTTFSLLTFILLFIINSTSIKRNDLIVIRKFRSGSGIISRINLRGKSNILFDKKDPASNVLISWAGAITDPISGCKIIQISEGHPTNDNLNSQVTESEWDKDVSRLTKAKSVADLAEAELFNQGLFGLKWQDIVLLIIGILCLAILGYLFMGAPDAIAKKTIEGLMNGNIQGAVQQVLNDAGILTTTAA